MSKDAVKAFASLRPRLPHLLADVEIKRNRGVSAEAVAEVGRQLAYRYDPAHRGYVDDTTEQLADALGMSPTKVERALPVLAALGLWVPIRRGGSRDRYGSRRMPGPELCAAAHRLGLNISTTQTALDLGPELTAPVRSDTPVDMPELTAPVRSDRSELTAPVRSDRSELTAPVRGTHRTSAGNSPHQCGTPIGKEKENPPTPLAPTHVAANPFEGRAREVVKQYAEIAIRQRSSPPDNFDAFAKACMRTAMEHPDLYRYLQQWPTAPASAVAAWLHGDKHSMGYFPEAV